MTQDRDANRILYGRYVEAKEVLLEGYEIPELARPLRLAVGSASLRAHWSRLLVAGLFVGFGTRTARGCTSGHGICGVSAFAAPSLASTAIFMGVAIVTAWLVGLAGVTP